MLLSKEGFPRDPYKYEGGWLGAAIGVVGLATSYFGGKEAQGDQKDANRQAISLEGRQIGIAERQDARAEELFGQYRDVYMPRERAFVSGAFEGLDPNVESARAVADVRAAGDVGEGVMQRELRSLGIDPSSPAYVGLSDQRNLREASMAAAAGTHARQRTGDINFERQHTALSLGRNLPATAGSLSSQSAGIFGDAAYSAGGRADQAAGLAGAYGQAFGSSLADLGDWWSNRPKKGEQRNDVELGG